mmetsp:Transcript_8459/g.24253  ORF Transcript_8459/g.24253 Transcript_8459/m.24253 type:complete len:217 (+) Transcript_8459:344-994(+)
MLRVMLQHLLLSRGDCLRAEGRRLRIEGRRWPLSDSCAGGTVSGAHTGLVLADRGAAHQFNQRDADRGGRRCGRRRPQPLVPGGRCGCGSGRRGFPAVGFAGLRVGGCLHRRRRQRGRGRLRQRAFEDANARGGRGGEAAASAHDAGDLLKEGVLHHHRGPRCLVLERGRPHRGPRRHRVAKPRLPPLASKILRAGGSTRVSRWIGRMSAGVRDEA